MIVNGTRLVLESITSPEVLPPGTVLVTVRTKAGAHRYFAGREAEGWPRLTRITTPPDIGSDVPGGGAV
jgi:hypothetical protein